jgi:predicted metalloprotease
MASNLLAESMAARAEVQSRVEWKMRLDQLPRSDNVEDRRSTGASFRVPSGRSGLGIGTIIVLGLVGYWLGIDPSLLIGGADILSGGGSSQQQSSAGSREAQTGTPSDQMGQFVSAVLGSTEAQWQKIFVQYGKAYEPQTERGPGQWGA